MAEGSAKYRRFDWLRPLLHRLFPGFEAARRRREARAAEPPRAFQTDGPQLYRQARRLMQPNGLDGVALEDILPALTQAYGKALAADHKNDIALTGLPLARILGFA